MYVEFIIASLISKTGKTTNKILSIVSMPISLPTKRESTTIYVLK